MLKGFIVLFTGLISYLFFNKKFTRCQIIGTFIVVVGLTTTVAPHPMLGNMLVLCAQFFLAGMFVFEEKILIEYDIHVLDVVGWEGIWGVLMSAIFMVMFYLLPGNILSLIISIGKDFGSYENPIQASTQVANNGLLMMSIASAALVIGPFNYYGTCLTKYSSAMHRCLIDASRMCIVWIISIVSGWEHFKFQQALGYSLVILGNLIYYQILSCDIEKTNTDIQVHRPNFMIDFVNRYVCCRRESLHADYEKGICVNSDPELDDFKKDTPENEILKKENEGEGEGEGYNTIKKEKDDIKS